MPGTAAPLVLREPITQTGAVRLPTASLGPLRERPFRLLFFGRTLSGVGDAIVPVALTFAVLKHGSATDLGIVLGCEWGGRLLFLLAGGVWADRLPRQLVMIGADVLRGSVQALVAVAFFTNSIRIWELAVAALLLGIGASFFNPASTGLVQSIVSPGRLQEANALLGLSRSAIDVAGPALSGAIVATLGFGVVFAVDAASFAASLVCLAAMRLPTRVERPERRSMVTEALEGLRAVRERRWMVAGLCGDVVFNFAFAAYFVLGPTVVKAHFGGARDWGVIMTVASIGSVVAGAVVLRAKPRHPLRIGYAGGLVVPAVLLALAVPLPLPVLALGAGLVFFNVVVVNTFWVTMEQQHVPPELISRVDSLSWVVSVLVLPVGLVVVGPIADAVGVGTTLVGAAALGAASVLGILSVRDVRDLERLDVGDDPAAEPAPASG